MDEFAFIRDELAAIAGPGAEGLTDDCAWVGQPGNWLVISTDTAIEGVHFPSTVKGAAATERAVRIAASDIAAKGASPVGMLVALSLPRDVDPRLPRGYALGIQEGALALGLPLLGGDTTRHEGKLSITVTVLGRADHKLLRSGAQVGDSIHVSGYIGDAALGLRYLQGQPLDADGPALAYWEEAFLRPHIDFAHGERIAKVATASLDCSDGLLADCAHIARESGVRLRIDADAVPFSSATRRHARSSTEALQHLVTAGDDYRIIYTAPADSASDPCIGRVVAGQAVQLWMDGKDITPAKLGYRH